MLVRTVKENADKGYDGIIVTHGSDTLQYSAAAIGYCMGLESLPIFHEYFMEYETFSEETLKEYLRCNV